MDGGNGSGDDVMLRRVEEKIVGECRVLGHWGNNGIGLLRGDLACIIDTPLEYILCDTLYFVQYTTVIAFYLYKNKIK